MYLKNINIKSQSDLVSVFFMDYSFVFLVFMCFLPFSSVRNATMFSTVTVVIDYIVHLFFVKFLIILCIYVLHLVFVWRCLYICKIVLNP